jgi:hypothetical protein
MEMCLMLTELRPQNSGIQKIYVFSAHLELFLQSNEAGQQSPSDGGPGKQVSFVVRFSPWDLF